MVLAQGLLRGLWGSLWAGGTTSKMAYSHRCWLEASVPHHMDFSTDFLKGFHNVAAVFPWVGRLRETAKRKLQCLRSGMPYFCHILLVPQTNSDPVWEGTTQRFEYQEVEDHWEPSWNWLPYYLCWIISLGMQNTAMFCTMRTGGTSIFVMFCDRNPNFVYNFQQY